LNAEVHRIVEQLYTDRRVREFISKQEPADLQQDLLSHCIMEVYRIAEKYPGKIEALAERNEIWPWFHGMACQQLRSNKSTFYTRYRRSFDPVEYIPKDIATMPDMDFDIKPQIDENFAEYAYRTFEQPKKVLRYEAKQLDLFNTI